MKLAVGGDKTNRAAKQSSLKSQGKFAGLSHVCAHWKCATTMTTPGCDDHSQQEMTRAFWGCLTTFFFVRDSEAQRPILIAARSPPAVTQERTEQHMILSDNYNPLWLLSQRQRCIDAPDTCTSLLLLFWLFRYVPYIDTCEAISVQGINSRLACKAHGPAASCLRRTVRSQTLRPHNILEYNTATAVPTP